MQTVNSKSTLQSRKGDLSVHLVSVQAIEIAVFVAAIALNNGKSCLTNMAAVAHLIDIIALPGIALGLHWQL